MSTFFIGDVHGCYDELVSLLAKIQIQDEDHLYFVGDLINKGPKSFEVVELVLHRPNTWSVVGNHEYFSLMEESRYLEALSDPLITESRKNWLRAQYIKSTEIREILVQYGYRDQLLALPHIIEREDFVVIHGGLHPEYGLSTPPEIMTMIRLHEDRPWYEYYTESRPIIYGHWAADGLRIRHNTIGIDTGCCFGGALTAYCLETREIYQVRANAVYKDPSHWKTSEL